MPLPLLLAGAAAAAALLGIGGHASAKEINEKAQELIQLAQKEYNDAKLSLEKAEKNCKDTLFKFGTTKQYVLNGSLQQFLNAYARIKDTGLNESIGIEELKKFELDSEDIVQIYQMTELYSGSIVSGAAGAATGSVIALAASGYLPVVTGTLSVAGTALAAGEIGTAVGLAGSALSFGAAVTPLAAVAAPVVLFTAISASIKADENLEKAQATAAQAQAAIEKMNLGETMYNGISQRANMLNALLEELNGMLCVCSAQLDGITKKKIRFRKDKKIDPSRLTEEEKKLVAISRALAGAVKAIIDTPLAKDGNNLTEESETVYQDTKAAIPEFKKQVEQVKSTHYCARPIALPKNKQISNNVNNAKHKKKASKFKLVVGLACTVLILGWVYTNWGPKEDDVASINNETSVNEEIVAANESVNTIDNVGQGSLSTTTSKDELGLYDVTAQDNTQDVETSGGAEGANPIQTDTASEPVVDIEPIELNDLVGTWILKSSEAYFNIFESSGKYYFAFTIPNGSVAQYLPTPAELSVDGEYAVASYDADNDGNYGTIRIKFNADGSPVITATMNGSSTPEYTSQDTLRYLITDEAIMYYEEGMEDYPVYKEYLAPELFGNI